jgi:flagellar protein FliO/FliZ
MRAIVIVLFLFGSVGAWSADSKLVDVDKSSKLSDYFKKINKKVSDDSEEKPLVKVNSTQNKGASRAEEDILLQEATRPVTDSGSMSPTKKMILALLSLLLLLGGFLMVVQKHGKKNGYVKIAQNIKVLTQKSIGPKKNLMLIRVAGETILLGVTDHNINHLKTLSLMEDELPDYTEPQFSSQLKDKIQQTQEEPSILTAEAEDVDGFSISSLNDVKKAVSRYSL